MRKNNYAPAALDNLNGDRYTGATINCLMELSAKGKPKDTQELKERISSYFQFCADRDMRVGIEGLCLSIGVTRQTFWGWLHGTINKPEEWVEICENARQVIATFLEQCGLSGKINPITYIFLCKNWLNYVDKSEVITGSEQRQEQLNASDLPILGVITEDKQDERDE